MNKYFLPIYHSELKPWIKWWILKRLNGGQSSLKAITLSSGTLKKVDKSKALSIKEYYGNTIQDGTPSPQSPVEIQTISGDNTFTINGVNYRVDFGGKNLLNNTATTQTINGVTFTVHEDKSVTVNGTASGNAILILNSFTFEESKSYRLSGCPSGGTGSTYKLDAFGSSGLSSDIGTGVTINVAGTRNVRIVIFSGITVNNLTFFPQIELGTVATRYSPYVANPIEFCKIGDYKDKIYNDNGTWKVEKKVSKIVLNGTESGWGYDSTYNYFRCPSYVYENLPTTSFQDRLSNYFENIDVWNTFRNSTTRNGMFIDASGYKICFRNINYTLTDDFKAWLTSNNVSVYYALATPTTETITNTNLISQLNALYELYVNSSKVTISNDSEIPFEVLLEYYGR